MARNIVLCFDGTNNKYAAANTNVVKIYAMLDRDGGDQITYYQPGIGTFVPPGVLGRIKTWIVEHLDLAIASLLDDHVLGGYRFIMSNYHEGDRIFIFGFSRGAYTARVLAGMLNKMGLLMPGNDELLPFAWNMYKHGENRHDCEGFKATFCRGVPVHFLGLWDTVSSIGWAWNPGHLPFTANNPIVKVVRHAVALDERRVSFPQNLWGEPPALAADVLQVWFPGVHSDVGGGYPESESGLSKIALKWMVEQAKLFDLRFDAQAEAEILPAQDTPEYAAPDVAAPMHESLTGWWRIAEYVPKPVSDPSKGFAKHWILHMGRCRNVPENSNIHVSVLDRMERSPSYHPKNLPTRRQIIQ